MIYFFLMRFINNEKSEDKRWVETCCVFWTQGGGSKKEPGRWWWSPCCWSESWCSRTTRTTSTDGRRTTDEKKKKQRAIRWPLPSGTSPLLFPHTNPLLTVHVATSRLSSVRMRKKNFTSANAARSAWNTRGSQICRANHSRIRKTKWHSDVKLSG